VCPPPLRWIDGIVDWAILPFQSLSLLLVIIKSLVHPTLTKNWYVILVKGPRAINSLIQDHLVCQKNPLELVYSGVWGPAPTSVGRKNYYVSFIDDYSKYTWIYLLKDISEVFQKFHEFQSLVERMLGRKIIVMQTGWGGEYQKLNTFFQHIGISHHVAESKHRHIVEVGLALLAHASMPLKFWDETFISATYLINRLSS
jgi:hypothetical protein